MARKEELFTLPRVVCIASTEKAILVEHEDLDEAVWIPLSMVHDDSEVYKKGTIGDLIIPEWLAKKKGFCD